MAWRALAFGILGLLPAMAWGALAFGILGLLLGRLLNVLIERLPRDLPLAFFPTACASCGRRMAVWEMLPLLGYVWARGRCPGCRTALPRRWPLVEALTGISFAYIYWHFGPGQQLAVASFYIALFIVITFIDMEHQLILDKVVFPAMAVALSLSLFWPGLDPVRAIIGGILAPVIFVVPLLFYKQGMGGGDLKLALLVGIVTGFPLVLVALTIAVTSGGIVALFLLLKRLFRLLTGRKRGGDAFPYGPFLAFGAIATLLWGVPLADYYVSHFLGAR